MAISCSSRERLLAAVDGVVGAPVPCCFMIFRALRATCHDEFAFALRQRDLGLDARVQIEDLPIRLSSEVTTREWAEPSREAGAPVLHRRYETPSGTLTAVARKSHDWPYGDRLPLFDDYFTPRALEYPVTQPSQS